MVRDFALDKPGRVAQYRTYGDVTVGFDADVDDRTVTIDGVAIPLVSQNTVLVNHVDVPHIRGIATTFRGDTTLAEAGVPRDHIAKVLNHVEGGPAATRGYDRYAYDAEKRDALDRWASRLQAIIEGKTGKVLEMRAG